LNSLKTVRAIARTARSRLASLEARAWAGRGDKRSALGALERAPHARSAVGDHDDDAGVFTFPAAK
jgi:hypothetical protein